MTSAQRRIYVLSVLSDAKGPVSASVLSREMSVSRQVIVGDIALLRAEGHQITATPRGYIIGSSSGGISHTIACCHSAEDTEKELLTVVDFGCTVEDVTVEHPVYGQITAILHLSSRYDVSEFLKKMADTKASPLSLLTDGIHLHRIICPDEAAFFRLSSQLSALGILLSD